MVHHVLFFPVPAQGHVTPMLTLAELLTADTDISVTFLNTIHIQNQLKTSSPSIINNLSRIPNFRFLTVHDGLPDDDPRSMHKFMALHDSLEETASERYREILVGEEDEVGWGKVNCVVADGAYHFGMEVAEEVDVPVMLMITTSVGSTWPLCTIETLVKNGVIPLKEDEDMNELVQGIPGIEILRRKDLPAVIQNSKSVDNPLLKFLSRSCNNLKRGTGIIINTTEFLESFVLSQMRHVFPVIYTIGPIQNIQDQASMWQADRSCLTWLNSQPDKTVVYISFGSVTKISKETFLEFWHGLVSSGKRFLWVIRPDMVDVVGEEMLLPQHEMGCIVKWAPQKEVLAHPAVGCFLTHCGWNSTLESIVAGVPMICWPNTADQPVNSRFVTEAWKIGVEMKKMIGREDVERMVRKVMEGEESEVMRKNIGEVSRAVRMAAEEGGTSHTNFKKLVEHIKSL